MRSHGDFPEGEKKCLELCDDYGIAAPFTLLHVMIRANPRFNPHSGLLTGQDIACEERRHNYSNV